MSGSRPAVAAVLGSPLVSYAALALPLAAIFIALAAGNQTAAFFALVAFAIWLLLYRLPGFAGDNAGVIVQWRWAPAGAIALWAVALFSLAREPAAAKFIYSAMTLACMIGVVGWAILLSPARTSSRRQVVVRIAACGAVVVWLLYGDSDWYISPAASIGVIDTHPYLVSLPIWWWGACLAVPAAGLVGHLLSRGQTRQLPSPDRRTRQALFVTALLCLLLMAALQAWDFIRMRVGLQILEGDAYGYLVSAYQLLERGAFNPPHMPLISLYLAMILAIAGDSTTAILLANAAAVMLTVALMLYALWLISADMRLVLLGGVLIVSLRTLYLYLWTPLTETLNTMLWAAAFVGLLAAIRRPSFAAHIGLGAVIGLLLLLRSQNLGGVLGLGTVYVALVIFVRANRTAAAARQSVIVVVALLAAATLPLFAWGEYRQATTGRFQVMDGRGAEILLGMNMPGISYGYGANLWEPNVASWKAQHPNASTADMISAVLRYRIERPAETATYIGYRTLELFDFRFPLFVAGSSYRAAFMVNLQLIIAVAASILLLATAARWLGLVIWAIFIPFVSIFIAIHVEARYRVPMDPLLTIGAAALFAQAMFRTGPPLPLRETPAAHRSSPLHVFALLLAAGMALVAGMRLVDATGIAGGRSKFIGAELRPAGATLVKKAAFDIAAYRDLPTWEDLLKTGDPGSLQGRSFRARFSLIGNLFQAGNRDRYARLGIGYEELQRVETTNQAGAKHIASSRMSVSFKGARIEEGIKQRGVIELIGRVRTVKVYHDVDSRDFVYVIIDALEVNCADEPLRQQCKR